MTSNHDLPPMLTTQPRLSRRGFLQGVGAGGAAMAGAGLLSACGSGGSEAPDPGATTEDRSDIDKTLNVSNWTLYIDRKKVDGERVFPTLQKFEEASDLTVTYTEDVNDNEEYFAKIRPILSAGRTPNADLFILTDWMAAKLIRLGWLQQLDKTNIPNADNLIQALKSPSFDPNRDYSMPWQSGLTGIAYDASRTEDVTSVSELLTRPDLKGQVTVLKEMRDTMGLVMLDQGIDPADFTDDGWSTALELVQTATDNGQIRSFTGNNYAQGLANGEISACFAWSGDVIQLQFDNPNIKFVVPEAGAMLWSDNMLIPVGALHKKNAELFMDWYYDPEIAAELAAWVNFISPVKGAKEAMANYDPSLQEDPLIFPDDADLAKLSIFKGLNDDEDAAYTEQFTALFT